MLSQIIKKEILEHITTPKMMISSIVIILIMVINGLVFNTQYNQKQLKMNRDVNAGNSALQDNPLPLCDFLFQERKLYQPPSRLGFIAMGKEEVLPNAMKIDFFKESEPEYYKSRNNFFDRFSSLDWSFLLVYVISFICLAFSYGAFSGEKNKGTLKLILSYTVPRGQLILAKLAGLQICITLPFLFGILINLLIIQLNSKILFSSSDYALVVVFIGIAALFIMMNLLLGLLISSLTSKPAHSLNLLLIVWILLVIIIPNMSWIFSQEWVKVPSEKEISEQLSTGIDELYASGKYSRSWRSSWAGQPPNETVQQRAAGRQAVAALTVQLHRDYVDLKLKQTDLAITLSKLSPFSLFRFIGERFSGNGYYGLKRLIEQSRVYRSTMNDYLIQKDQQDPDSYHLMWNEKWSARTFSSQKPVNFEEIPKFRYKQATFTEVLHESMFDILILALWCLLLYAASFIAFMRYDVR